MKIKGLGVAMVTPFNNDLSVDFDSLEKLTESLVVGGVDFLVVMGTTGEAATLTIQEKNEVLSHVINTNAGRIPVVYGIGGNNTWAVCEELKSFDTKGVSAILSASPGYNKPTQEGIFQHFKALGEVSPLPIILYNVPGRTGSNVEAETCIRIANEVPNIVAVKEASGDLNQIEEHPVLVSFVSFQFFLVYHAFYVFYTLAVNVHGFFSILFRPMLLNVDFLGATNDEPCLVNILQKHVELLYSSQEW